MSFWMLLLIIVLAAIFVVAAVTVIFAILGAQRGRQEEWARNAFTATLGVFVISAVVFGAVWSIRALDNLTILSTSQEELSILATPSAVFDATGSQPLGTAVPITTPEPGTVIRATPVPERVTGVNYGAGYELTNCNDYVYLTETTTVYTGPGTDFDSIGSVTAGATIKRIGYNDEWSLIDYNENYAFVSNASLIVNE